MSKKRSRAASSSLVSSVNLVSNIIDTAGEANIDSVFGDVTTEMYKFKKIQPLEPPRSYKKTEDDLERFESFLKSRVQLAEMRNTSTAASSSSSTVSSQNDIREQIQKQERDAVDVELRAMSVSMQMSNNMNFSTKDFVAPGSDAYKALLENAQRHRRRAANWAKYTPNQGDHPIPCKKLKLLHSSLFEGILANNKFGTKCKLKWMYDHLASDGELVILHEEAFTNHEKMKFLALSFWVVRSLYYKLYVVFLVDRKGSNFEYYYVDYLYVRFCKPIDNQN